MIALCILTNQHLQADEPPYDTTVDGIIYHIENFKATVTGVEDTSIMLGGIYSEVDGFPVTAIGDNAFKNCTALEIISIPDSVTSIGNSAFYYCSSLQAIGIPTSVTSIGDIAFYRCKALSSIVIPHGVTTIGHDTFQYCTSLQEVTIPDSVTSISWQAFLGCTSLKNVTIPSSVTSIGEKGFNNCGLTNLILPEGIKSLSSQVFGFCPLQKTLNIPASMKYINGGAFGNSNNLEEFTISDGNTSFQVQDGVLFDAGMTRLVAYPSAKKDTVFVIPDGITSIYNAFSGCKFLQEITIPNSVTTIAMDTFFGCSSLLSITIPDSVTTIGNSAFSVCSSLKSIVVGSGVTNIHDSAFTACNKLSYVQTDNEYVKEWFAAKFPNVHIYGMDETPTYDTTVDGIIYHVENFVATVTGVENDEINSVAIPAEVDGVPVTAIGTGAFALCRYLSSVTLPEGITLIDDRAFINCYRLSAIELPSTLVSIGTEAFNYCESLAALTIPASVEIIGESAFGGQNQLSAIVVDEGNEHFVSIDGVLYEKDDEGVPTVLLRYPPKKEGSSFSVPNGVEVLSGYSFSNCEKLTTITLSASVDDALSAIGDGYGALNYYGKLATVNVEVGNTHFSSRDGVLFTADLSELLLYPRGKKSSEFTVPATMVAGEYLLAYARSLQRILVEDGNEEFASQDGVLYSADLSTLVVYPAGRKEDVFRIPDSVELISDSSYFRYWNFKALIIGENMTTVNFDSLFKNLYLVYVQTDNEAVAEWFAENRPDVTVVGMDEEPPVLPYDTTVNGIIYHIEGGEAKV
ncbi:MAG: leucine-rich repeat domain-containing protein, partial [Victivallales bacterium]|nr:leucine-rich repeat domain-containing protein [Victivallales bacterium]